MLGPLLVHLLATVNLMANWQILPQCTCAVCVCPNISEENRTVFFIHSVESFLQKICKNEQVNEYRTSSVELSNNGNALIKESWI